MCRCQGEGRGCVAPLGAGWVLPARPLTPAAPPPRTHARARCSYPPLHAWAVAHVAALHAPPRPVALTLTNGSNHGIEVCVGWVGGRGRAVLQTVPAPPAARHLAVPAAWGLAGA